MSLLCPRKQRIEKRRRRINAGSVELYVIVNVGARKAAAVEFPGAERNNHGYRGNGWEFYDGGDGGGASQSRIDLYKNHCGSGDGGVWREVLAPTLGKEGETIRWAVSK